jgi:hypothetical protein
VGGQMGPHGCKPELEGWIENSRLFGDLIWTGLDGCIVGFLYENRRPRYTGIPFDHFFSSLFWISPVFCRLFIFAYSTLGVI